MNFGWHHLAQLLTRAIGKIARNALWQGGRLFAAVLFGTVGLGFVIYAAFASLRLAVRPELAALVTGAVLLGIAAVLVRSFGWSGLSKQTNPPAAAPAPAADPAPNPGGDAATLAVFTLAFVLGRQFADRQKE